MKHIYILAMALALFACDGKQPRQDHTELDACNEDVRQLEAVVAESYAGWEESARINGEYKKLVDQCLSDYNSLWNYCF
jgi:hypothetical protein